jgi:hypothetical protein
MHPFRLGLNVNGARYAIVRADSASRCFFRQRIV